MAINIYHPSKSGKGFAASFWFSERNNSVFATILKQSGWDAQKQEGTFKENLNDPNGKINIKLNATEIAAILDCIERGRAFNTFHDNDDFPKQIGFSPWENRGYSFTINVSNKQDASYKNSFYIGLTFAEGRLIREYLIVCLHKYFAITDNPTFKKYSTNEQQPQLPIKDELTGL